MRELDVIIHNETGLHARPAKVLVNTAKQFSSDIRVQHNGKKVNAKSMLGLLSLGVKAGGQLRIIFEGADEDSAFQTLKEAIHNGLGEEEHVAQVEGLPDAKPTNGTAVAPPLPSSNMIQGIAAAPGIAIGPLHHFQTATLEVNETYTHRADEEARLAAALATAKEQLKELHAQMVARGASSEAEIFEAHSALLDDPDLWEGTQTLIHQQHSAGNAWQQAYQAQADLLTQLDNPLLAARAADLRDVGERVLKLLLGVTDSQTGDLPEHPVILCAHDLAPSDTALLDPAAVLGICTAVGGPNAHSAIIARALGLPAVVSAGPQIHEIEAGTEVILDGGHGSLTLEPDTTTLAAAREKQAGRQAAIAAAKEAAAENAVTQDGRHIEVAANIGGLSDAEKAFAAGAEGVGLLRTEFLFLGRQEAPSEDSQFAVYRDIVKALRGRPVIFRTLDIGGDKPLPYIDVPHEENPFLGERGIRLCLNRPELLRQQVRAILRARQFGPLRIMFPMIGNLSEWRAARQIVHEIQVELGAPPIEVGIMVEVPSAALLADVLATEVDFFSIGTNDLTQYTLAIDRMHATLAGQADGLHPAVLRLIAQTVEAAHAHKKWVGVCGELGSDPDAIPILLGLGVDELSVSAPAVATSKAQIRTLSILDCQNLARQALACSSAEEVRQLVRASI